MIHAPTYQTGIRVPDALSLRRTHATHGIDGLLQRKCACGGTPGPSGECEQCRNKRLQRAANHSSTINPQPSGAPPIVHEVVNSAGQSLDLETRAFMEPRFGLDFSRVRVHTDGRAAESARAVNALAYTVGQDLVFGSGQYAPRTQPGKHLLAHELAHTIQQRNVSSTVASLEVDPPHSSGELAASQAAEAALSSQPGPRLASVPGAIVSRQVAESSTTEIPQECRADLRSTDLLRVQLPTAEAPSGRYTITRVERVNDNERRVQISTGRRYIVRRTPWTTTDDVPSTSGSARPGIDRQQVWLDVEFCRGSTEGKIRVGANVPQEVIQLILRTISSGGDVAAAWRQASITPSVTGSLQVGHWRVNLGAQTTVDSSGQVQSVQGEASVSTDTSRGRITVGASGGSQPVGGNPLGGAQGQITITFEPGASTPAPRCTTQRIRAGFTYECLEERDAPPQVRPGIQTVTTRDRRIYNLFFRYAVPEFDQPRNSLSWTELATDLNSGFTVRRIEGWASPEGPIPRGPGFMGNKELSEQRAQTTRTRIAGLCGAGNCIAPDAEVVGLGERLTPTDPNGQPLDVSGRPLEQHVVDTFPTDPGEASVRSPALTEQLRRARSLHQRAELIYPQLRRSIVTLQRDSTRTDPCNFTVPGHPEQAYLPGCPNDIREAAFPNSGASR